MREVAEAQVGGKELVSLLPVRVLNEERGKGEGEINNKNKQKERERRNKRTVYRGQEGGKEVNHQ